MGPGFGVWSYFFLLSVSLLLYLRLLLSGPLYEEVPPFLRSLIERLSLLLLFSLIYGLFYEPDFVRKLFAIQRVYGFICKNRAKSSSWAVLYIFQVVSLTVKESIS